VSRSRAEGLGDRISIPGDLLLGLVPLTAVVVLIVNDNVLKGNWPGPITGKVSDAAGLVFFPFLLVGLWDLLAAMARRRPSNETAVVVAVAMTGVVFGLVKATSFGADAFQLGLGLLQWPFQATATALTGGQVPELGRRVALVADPTDLAMLPALALPLGLGIARRAIVDDVATRAWRENLAVSGLAYAMLLGAVVDGWAHSYLSSTAETILTPWHAIVYMAFALLVAVFVGGMVARARDRVGHVAGPLGLARAVRDEIPLGYGWSVVGIIVFLGAGLGDSLWHVVFGIEADAAALVSPTHVLLGVGAGLIASGPVRSAWLAGLPGRWPDVLPAGLGLATITGIVAFATHLAHPLVDPWPMYPYDQTSQTYWSIAQLGVASAALQAAILAGGLAVTLRAWPSVQTGMLALVVIASTVPLVFLHDEVRLAAAVVAGALAAELCARLLRDRSRPETRIRITCALVPGAIWLSEIGLLALREEVRWSAHLLAGTLVVAIATGALVGLLATLPGPPAASRRTVT
jgi:hypothetical protein